MKTESALSPLKLTLKKLKFNVIRELTMGGLLCGFLADIIYNVHSCSVGDAVFVCLSSIFPWTVFC